LGVIPGLFDVLPLGRFARAAGVDIGDIPVIGDMINKLGPESVEGMVSRVQRAGITGGIEGAQEAAQNIAQNLIEQGYSPETPTFGGTLEEGLIGGGAGAIFQGLLDLAVGRRQRGPSAPTAPEEQLALPAPEEQLALPAPGAGISGILTDQRQSVDPDTGAILGRDETGAILGRDETGLSRSDIAVQELQAVIDESRANISRLSESARDLPFTPAQEDSGASTMGRGNDPVFAPVDAELDRIRAAQEEIDNIRNRPEEFRDAGSQRLDQQESELVRSLPAQDVEAELRSAVETTEPDTAIAIAVRKALVDRGADPVRIAAQEETQLAEEARIAEEEAVRQQTEAEISEFESDAVGEVASEVAPEVAPEVEELTQGTLPSLGRSYGEKVRQERIDARPA
jgi:hypothetical protein